MVNEREKHRDIVDQLALSCLGEWVGRLCMLLLHPTYTSLQKPTNQKTAFPESRTHTLGQHPDTPEAS